jgi:hypothetical protein
MYSCWIVKYEGERPLGRLGIGGKVVLKLILKNRVRS